MRPSTDQPQHRSTPEGPAPEDMLICFNPECTFPYSRIFKPTHQHLSVPKCRNWVITAQHLQECLTREVPGGELKGLVLDFVAGDMCGNFGAWGMASRVDWDQFLNGYKVFYMQKAEQQVNSMIARLRVKLASLKSSETVSSAESLLHYLRSGSPHEQFEARRKVQQIIINSIAPLQNKRIEVSCLKAKQMEARLFETAANFIQERIYNEGSDQATKKQDTKCTNEALDLFLRDSSGPFNKIQQVTSMCGKRPNDFVNKSRYLALKCPFCDLNIKHKISPEKFELQARMIKKEISGQMLRHFEKEHYQFIEAKFKNKKGPIGSHSTPRHPEAMEITFQEFVQQFSAAQYSRLVIVDREAGMNSCYEPSSTTYYIEIVSEANKKMVKSKYITTPDRKTTQFLINYIALFVSWGKDWIPAHSVRVESKAKDLLKVHQIIATLNMKPSASLKKQQPHKNEDNPDDHYYTEFNYRYNQDASRLIQQQLQLSNSLLEQPEEPRVKIEGNYQ